MGTPNNDPSPTLPTASLRRASASLGKRTRGEWNSTQGGSERAAKYIRFGRQTKVFVRDTATRKVGCYDVDCGQPLLHVFYAHSTALGVVSSKLCFKYNGEVISDDVAWSTRCGMVSGYVDCYWL